MLNKPRKAQDDAGLTLIEVLVALFIGSVIALLVGMGISQYQETSDVDNARSDRREELAIATAAINKDVQNATAVIVASGNELLLRVENPVIRDGKEVVECLYVRYRSMDESDTRKYPYDSDNIPDKHEMLEKASISCEDEDGNGNLGKIHSDTMSDDVKLEYIAHDLTNGDVFKFFDPEGNEIVNTGGGSLPAGAYDISLIRTNFSASALGDKNYGGVVEYNIDSNITTGLVSDDITKGDPNNGPPQNPNLTCPAWIRTDTSADGKPILTWNDVTQADNYYVFIDGVKVAETSDTTWTDSTYNSAEPRFMTYSAVPEGLNQTCPTSYYIPTGGSVPVLNVQVGPNVDSGQHIQMIDGGSGSVSNPRLASRNSWPDWQNNRSPAPMYLPRWTKVAEAKEYRLYGNGNLELRVAAGEMENNSSGMRPDCNVRGVDLICPPEGLPGAVNENKTWRVEAIVDGVAPKSSPSIKAETHRQTNVKVDPDYRRYVVNSPCGGEDRPKCRYAYDAWNNVSWSPRAGVEKWMLFRNRGSNTSVTRGSMIAQGSGSFTFYRDNNVRFGETWSYYVIGVSQVGSNKVWSLGPASGVQTQLQYPAVPFLVPVPEGRGSALGHPTGSGNHVDGQNWIWHSMIDGATRYELRIAKDPRNVDNYETWSGGGECGLSNSQVTDGPACRWIDGSNMSSLRVYDVVAVNATGKSPNAKYGIDGDRLEIVQRPTRPEAWLAQAPVMGANIVEGQAGYDTNKSNANATRFGYNGAFDNGTAGGFCLSEELYDVHRIESLECTYQVAFKDTGMPPFEVSTDWDYRPETTKASWASWKQDLDNGLTERLTGMLDWGKGYVAQVAVCNEGGCSEPADTPVNTYPGPFEISHISERRGEFSVHNAPHWFRNRTSSARYMRDREVDAVKESNPANGLYIEHNPSAGDDVTYGIDLANYQTVFHEPFRRIADNITETTSTIRVARPGTTYAVKPVARAGNGLVRDNVPERNIVSPPLNMDFAYTGTRCSIGRDRDTGKAPGYWWRVGGHFLPSSLHGRVDGYEMRSYTGPIKSGYSASPWLIGADGNPAPVWGRGMNSLPERDSRITVNMERAIVEKDSDEQDSGGWEAAVLVYRPYVNIQGVPTGQMSPVIGLHRTAAGWSTGSSSQGCSTGVGDNFHRQIAKGGPGLWSSTQQAIDSSQDEVRMYGAELWAPQDLYRNMWFDPNDMGWQNNWNPWGEDEWRVIADRPLTDARTGP